MKAEDLAKLLLDHIGYDVQFCLWNTDGTTVYRTYDINGICFVGHWAQKCIILSSDDEPNKAI